MDKSKYLFQIYFWAAFMALLLEHWVFDRRIKKYMQQQKVKADAAFWQSSLQATDKGIVFDPTKVRVLDEQEQFEGSRWRNNWVYTLKRVARTETGDYFWFRFRTDAAIFMKPINQATARLLLKEKYIPVP